MLLSETLTLENSNIVHYTKFYYEPVRYKKYVYFWEIGVQNKHFFISSQIMENTPVMESISRWIFLNKIWYIWGNGYVKNNTYCNAPNIRIYPIANGGIPPESNAHERVGLWRSSGQRGTLAYSAIGGSIPGSGSDSKVAGIVWMHSFSCFRVPVASRRHVGRPWASQNWSSSPGEALARPAERPIKSDLVRCHCYASSTTPTVSGVEPWEFKLKPKRQET